MVLINESDSGTLPIGASAPDFNLPATDGKTYSLAACKDSKAVVLSFTCNHCPYAQAVEDRFMALVDEFTGAGATFLAINPNNDVTHPADSFEKMKERAAERGFNFPYLRDESQDVAHAYGAVCTPHYFVLDGAARLVYEGRLDDNWQEPEKATTHELRDAIEAVLAGQPVPVPNTNPMGCSIKWK